jgi:hypothetical protein
LTVVAMVGCSSAEPKEARSVPADSPPPAVATDELPDFGEPKPPAPAASKTPKESRTTREALLHDDGR